MATKFEDQSMEKLATRKPVRGLRWLLASWIIPALALLWYLIKPNVMITNLLKSNCGTFADTTSDGSVTYRYQDLKTCDTFAVQATISRAIEHRIKEEGAPVATECLDLTSGGTWNGFLLIGPTKNFNASIYCGPELKLLLKESCTSSA